MSKIIITVKNKSRISLVKLVVTIISVISSKKGNITFEVTTFGGPLLLAFANTRKILTYISGEGVVALGTLRHVSCSPAWHAQFCTI